MPTLRQEAQRPGSAYPHLGEWRLQAGTCMPHTPCLPDPLFLICTPPHRWAPFHRQEMEAWIGNMMGPTYLSLEWQNLNSHPGRQVLTQCFFFFFFPASFKFIYFLIEG